MNKAKLAYFEKEDVLHLAISDEPESGSIELSPNITAELNEKGELIGIEILNASAFIRDSIMGGYQIPAYYTSATGEFLAAKKAAVMDRSFAGKLRVFGKDRESLLHRLTTNEMRNLPPDGGVVNIFTNAKGRVVDVVEMFVEENSIFMLTTPARATLVKEWIEKYTFIEDVRCEDVTSQYALVSFFGEESVKLLRQSCGWEVEDLPMQHARSLRWEDKNVIVHRSGAITPVQFNLILPIAEMAKLWERATAQATPIGHAAYEMLRIHRGLPAVGKEITDEYNPHEAGLYPFINFEKGCYIGQEVIARLDSYQKVQRQLRGITLEVDAASAQPIPAAGAPIYLGEQLIGQLTSACFSPEYGQGIGLAVVRKQFAASIAPVQVRWPERSVAGRLRALPFTN
jgi:folate-binding protein YgfZ